MTDFVFDFHRFCVGSQKRISAIFRSLAGVLWFLRGAFQDAADYQGMVKGWDANALPQLKKLAIDGEPALSEAIRKCFWTWLGIPTQLLPSTRHIMGVAEILNNENDLKWFLVILGATTKCQCFRRRPNLLLARACDVVRAMGRKFHESCCTWSLPYTGRRSASKLPWIPFITKECPKK